MGTDRSVIPLESRYLAHPVDTDEPIRGVLFDLDNALFDRDRAFFGWAQWFVRERLGIAEGAAMRPVVDLLVELDANGYGPKDALFRRVKREHPRLADDVDALTTAFYQQYLEHVAPDEGATRLLEALAERGIPWGIVTNGSANQRRKVAKLGLDRCAACVLVSEVEGVRKPDPRIFRRAVALLRLEPAEILFVGDNPEADIAGAAGVGMRTAWVRRGRTWPDHLASAAPNRVVDALDELIDGW